MLPIFGKDGFLTLVRLNYTTMSQKGPRVREIVFGNSKNTKLYDVAVLKHSLENVVALIPPDQLNMTSVTKIRQTVLAEYQEFMKRSKSTQRLQEEIAQRNKVPETKDTTGDFTLKEKDITLIDTSVQTGQTALILASSYRGKTTLLVKGLENILKEESYDIIVIFTESINSVPLEKISSDPRVIILNGYFPGLVRLAYRINRAVDNRYRFLFVLDDVVTMRSSAVFQKQILTMRNSNISTIALIQYAKLISPAQRGSFHNIYFLGNGGDFEMSEYIVKNWLLGHIKSRGITKKDAIFQWYLDKTTMKDCGCGCAGNMLHYSGIKNELTVQKRPKP
jgi:hypothetical protein